MPKNDKKVINGWALYDWANSTYYLVIATAIFPVYFISVTRSDIRLFGDFSVSNSSLYSYVVSLSYLIIATLSPFLSGIADFGGKRMFFLKFFTTMGAIACAGMFLFTGDATLWLGTGLFAIATIGAAGGQVFYNAYLPEIVTPDQYDRVSAKGYALGYIGSVLLLLLILFISQKPLWFGIPESSNLPYRLGFVFVGVWWLGFAQITFNRLPKGQKGAITRSMILKGFQEIVLVFNRLRQSKNLSLFLISMLFYSAGVQTVIYLASVFATEELKFETTELIIVILLLQIIAIFGAYIFAWISRWMGNKRTLLLQIVIWIAITVLAFLVESKTQFYLIAGLVGLVMGGIQSLSRSTYSKLVDDHPEDLTSYFSFYEIVIKVSIILGTFLFGLVNHIFGGLRMSVLSLSFLFITGFILLLFVRVARRKREK